MTKYVLAADTKSEGTCYYMNIIMMTGDLECAEMFNTKEEAEAKKEYFKNFFHYETVEPKVIEVQEQ